MPDTEIDSLFFVELAGSATEPGSLMLHHFQSFGQQASVAVAIDGHPEPDEAAVSAWSSALWRLGLYPREAGALVLEPHGGIECAPDLAALLAAPSGHALLHLLGIGSRLVALVAKDRAGRLRTLKDQDGLLTG